MKPFHCASTSWAVILLLSSLVSTARVTNPSKVPRNAILLSKLSTLTLRSGKSTSSRRVSPVPQLQCVGPSSVCALYDVEVVRCKSDGADYDDNNVQWTCSASLPEEFKLGGTDVSCEGYESSDDPYVLKGSCGLEYRLVLTAAGERKYGLTNNDDSWSVWRGKNKMEKLSTFMFWLFFAGVVAAMVLSAFGCFGRPPRTGAPGTRRGWGGGGGGGGAPYNGGPPPPYSDTWSPPKPHARSSSSGYGQSAQGEPWRPGFWTGAAAGASASYLLSNQNQPSGSLRTGNPANSNTGSGWFGSSSRREGAGEGSSRSNSGPSYSSGRYESTGFGSTSRR